MSNIVFKLKAVFGTIFKINGRRANEKPFYCAIVILLAADSIISMLARCRLNLFSNLSFFLSQLT